MKQTATMHLTTASGTTDVFLPSLKLACLLQAASSLAFRHMTKIDGCYEISGSDVDLKVILRDPLAAKLIWCGYPYGIPGGERIELMGVRFPEGMRP